MTTLTLLQLDTRAELESFWEPLTTQLSDSCICAVPASDLDETSRNSDEIMVSLKILR